MNTKLIASTIVAAALAFNINTAPANGFRLDFGDGFAIELGNGKHDRKHERKHDRKYDHKYDKYDHKYDKYDHKYDKYDHKYTQNHDRKYDRKEINRFIKIEQEKWAALAVTRWGWLSTIESLRKDIKEFRREMHRADGSDRHALRDVIQDYRAIIRSLKDLEENSKATYISGLRAIARIKFPHRVSEIVDEVTDTF